MTEAENILLKTYNRYQIVLERGEGVYLYDIENKKYLDFSSGIGVFALGYGNEEYNNALKEQIDKLIHTSNYYYNRPSIKAGKLLLEATKMNRVFFTNSGTEAIEGAIKIARKYYYNKNNEADSQIIAMESSFHGRSMGALSITGTKQYREAFEPLIGGVKFAKFNDLDSVKALVSDKTAAIILEPIQGEGGLRPATQEFIQGVEKICKENDILLILDEIQCGMGRVGEYFAYEHYGISPDVVTVAKAIGGGVPVGAFLANDKTAKTLVPGDHGTTFGGNPFTAAAVAKVFELYEEEKVLENVKEVAPYLEKSLDALMDEFDEIIERRGIGLMQGIEFNKPVADIILKAMDKGLIIIAAGTNVIRFLPPLVITKDHIDEMISILKECM